jgi:hypothetical protein
MTLSQNNYIFIELFAMFARSDLQAFFRDTEKSLPQKALKNRRKSAENALCA